MRSTSRRCRIVTAAQLAAELGTDPSAWAAGCGPNESADTSCGWPAAGARWEFSRDADRLAEEFRAARRAASERFGGPAQGRGRDPRPARRAPRVPLEPKEIKLAAGAPVHVDAVSDDGNGDGRDLRPPGRAEGRPTEEGGHRHAQADHHPPRTRRPSSTSPSPTRRPRCTPPAAAGWPRRCGPGTSRSWWSTSRRNCATRSSPPRPTSGWSTPTRPSATSPPTT